MIARPCNINARCAPCAESSSPYQNLSAEAPDPINYIGIAFVQSIPRENQEPQIDQIPTIVPLCPWCITNIVGNGTGDTQQQANQNAQVSGQQQLAGEQGVTLVGNTAYGGAVPCAGGGSSSYTIPAGTYFGNTQEEADALAQSNFDELAFSNTICFVTSTLPPICLNGSYSQTLQATGGVIIELGHYVWEVTAGSLPGGLILDPISGEIYGTATSGGSFTFTITASDDLSNNASKDFTIVVAGVDNAVFKTGVVGEAYTKQLTMNPGTLTGVWSLTSGALPGNVSLSPEGLISGTPLAGGHFSFTISITLEDVGLVCSEDFTWNVGAVVYTPTATLSNVISIGGIGPFGVGDFVVQQLPGDANTGKNYRYTNTGSGDSVTITGYGLGSGTLQVPILEFIDDTGAALCTVLGYSECGTNHTTDLATARANNIAYGDLAQFTISDATHTNPGPVQWRWQAMPALPAGTPVFCGTVPGSGIIDDGGTGTEFRIIAI